MRDLSEWLTVAHLSWATWVICSWLLFWHERFTHSRLFVLSESLTVTHLIWVIWANEWWANSQPWFGFSVVIGSPVLCLSFHLHSYWVICIVIGALTGLSLVIGALCFVLHFIFTTYYWVICKVIGGPVLCPSLHLHSYWVRWFGFSVHCTLTVYSSDWGPCALSSTSSSLLLC